MSEQERFFTSTLKENDTKVEQQLRPQYFEDFPGQESIKDRMKIFCRSGKDA